MTSQIKKNYFTTSEIAKACQVSPASVSRWIKSGKVKASRTFGGHQRITRDALLHLLREMNIPIPPELQTESGIKALIIDDNDSMRKLIRVFLESEFDSFTIDEVSDGFQAGVKLVSFRPDLVTLDIKMPGMDGFAVCEFIKKTAELEHTKIMIVSGQTDPGLEKKISEAGADAFLRKPVSQGELHAKIMELFKDDPVFGIDRKNG
ncbi:MAG: response regulator [Pseudobdellovibrionaceae bacterium]